MSLELELDGVESIPPTQRLCRYLTEWSPQPMVALEGATHVVIYVNPAFCRLVGKDRKDLVGSCFSEAVPEGKENGCLALLDRVYRSGNAENLAEQEHRQAPFRPIYWSYAVWAILGVDERPAGVIIQVTDVTETAIFRKQSMEMNEALLISASQQHELAEVAGTLTERLQATAQSRDHFLAVLSHELRNPLAAIRNAVALASHTGTREDLEWSRDVTARQLKNFAHLIDDLLDVSRVSQGKIQLRKEFLDAGTVLMHAVEAVTPIFEKKTQILLLSFKSEGLIIEADTTRLEQMLVNLLTNAAKYTPAGGRIELLAKVESDEFVCRVRDNGVGISSELLSRMFELFTQADRSLERSEGGLGIGLTLVRSLAELHGGTITATSDGPGKGSEFVLRLPTGQMPAASTEVLAVEPRKAPTARLRVLVVDDNVDTATGMAKLLEYSGHTVWVAYHGHDAVNLAREHEPQVILLDIGLPGMDGYEVAANLRQEECCKDAMIIAVSGYGEEQARSRSGAAGFDHHLVKPINIEKLLLLLERPRMNN